MHPRVEWAITRARSAVLLATFDPNQPRDEDGKWTDGGGGFSSASPQEFITARDKSTRQQYLSPLKPEDLSGHTLLTTADKKVGAAIDPQGDLQNVFNNGGPKGAAADVIVAAIDQGARTLDCYDGHLPRYYRQFGFEETGRIKFNPEFAHGWDVQKGGQPDVVFMAWKGYMNDGAKGAIERAKSGENWVRNERSDNYATDYDTAKEQSRAAARRTKDHRSGGGELRAPADRAGNLAVARTSPSTRQPLAERFNPQRRIAWAFARARAAVLLQKWDESEHPRDEAGRFTDSGGGGGAAPSETPPTLVAEEHRFLVSERPSQEKIDKWRKELQARADELEAQGKAGNEEDGQIGRMLTALNQYMQASDGALEREDAGINVVYDIENGNLLGAAFTSVDQKDHVAIIESLGAASHNAGVRNLQAATRKFGDKAVRLESKAWVDEPATHAMYEAAGFKLKPGSTGPAVTFVKEDIPGAIKFSAEHGAKILGASQATARLLGYEPNLVSINMGEHPFEVGGKGGYMAAGLAFLDTGRIEMFPRQLPTIESAVNVTAHEVAHQKYEAVLMAIVNETREVMSDPDTRDGMNADGSLKPPLDARYPVYSRFLKHDAKWKQRVKDDGVTPYSTAYWKAAQTDKPYIEVGKGTPVRSAEHETIAEIARLETSTGKVQGKPSWRSYYNDIMKTYDELKASGKLPARKTPA